MISFTVDFSSVLDEFHWINVKIFFHDRIHFVPRVSLYSEIIACVTRPKLQRHTPQHAGSMRLIRALNAFRLVHVYRGTRQRARNLVIFVYSYK